MLPTKQQSKTIDKSVGITVCYKSIRTQYKSEHFMDTIIDLHFHSVQTGHSCLKIKFNKPTSKAKACNTGFTFDPSDSVMFFIDKFQQSDKDDNCEESFFEEKQSRDESFCVNSNDYLSDGCNKFRR